MFVLLLMLNPPNSTDVTLTSVPGFKTQQECDSGGKAVQEALRVRIRYVCLKQ